MDKYSFVKDSFVNKYSFVKDTLISFDSLVDKYSFVKETLVGFNSLILMLDGSYTEPGCVLKLDSHKILHQLVRFDTIFFGSTSEIFSFFMWNQTVAFRTGWGFWVQSSGAAPYSTIKGAYL